MKIFKFTDRFGFMPLFEVYAALSLSFAFAILTLFEKVMKPGYEKKISLFEEALKEKYLEDLSKATKELSHARERNEIISRVEEIAESSWEVRNRYKRLGLLIKLKFVFFLGWMASLSVSILGIYAKEAGVSLLSGFDWYGGSSTLFFSMLIFTISYVFSLFRFDHFLSKFEEKERPRVPTISLRPRVRKIVYIDKIAEENVIKILEKNNIPFNSEKMIDGHEWDLIIPDTKNPKLFAEIKRLSYFSPAFLYLFLRKSMFIKSKYPSCKVVLITNLKTFSARMEKEVRKYVDNIFDLDKLEDFIKFIKSELD